VIRQIPWTEDRELKEEWRSWLAANHDDEREIRLVFYLKATRKQTVTLSEAKDEAIFFAGLTVSKKKIGRERYALLFTPR